MHIQHKAIALAALALALAAPAARADEKHKEKPRHGATAAQLRADDDERGQMRFRGMDRNGDGVISRSEWRGNDVSFRNHDRNGDGVLSGAEVAAGGLDDDDFDDRRNRREERFALWDLNDDGRLSRSEWRGTAEMFERLDDNNDGFISRSEAFDRFVDDDYDRDDDDFDDDFDDDEEVYSAAERFAMLDRNDDGRLARSEWRSTASLFDRLDRDDNGFLTRAEYVDRSRLSDADQARSQRFALWDGNDDGRLSRREWRASTAAFERLDRSHDGYVSRTEFLGYPLTDDDFGGFTLAESRFDAFDHDDDGRLRMGEWHGTRAEFDGLDRNGDGVITRAEVGLGVDPLPRSDFALGRGAQFDAFDHDRDGRLEMGEWHGSRADFDRLDRNGDGRLTRDEFVRG